MFKISGLALRQVRGVEGLGFTSEGPESSFWPHGFVCGGWGRIIG